MRFCAELTIQLPTVKSSAAQKMQMSREGGNQSRNQNRVVLGYFCKMNKAIVIQSPFHTFTTGAIMKETNV